MASKEDVSIDVFRRSLFLGALGFPVWSGLFSLASAQQVTGWPPPASARLTYDMEGVWNVPISGSGIVDWLYSTETKRYVLDLNISAFFLSFFYGSQGRLEPMEGFFPEQFREKRIGKDRTIIFDYNAEQVIFTWKSIDDAGLWELPSGIQDINSVMMQIGFLIATGSPDAKVGHVLEFPIARMGTIKFWKFEILDRPTVKTKAGDFETWHVSRLPEGHDKDLRVEFWLAPALHYMPVQMTFHLSEGDYLNVILEKIKSWVF